MKVEVEFDVVVKKVVEDGIKICHIPAIDCFFAARNDEQIKNKTESMVNLFVKHTMCSSKLEIK